MKMRAGAAKIHARDRCSISRRRVGAGRRRRPTATPMRARGTTEATSASARLPRRSSASPRAWPARRTRRRPRRRRTSRRRRRSSGGEPDASRRAARRGPHGAEGRRAPTAGAEQQLGPVEGRLFVGGDGDGEEHADRGEGRRRRRAAAPGWRRRSRRRAPRRPARTSHRRRPRRRSDPTATVGPGARAARGCRRARRTRRSRRRSRRSCRTSVHAV